MAMFYMKYKGREKAAKVVEFMSVYGTIGEPIRTIMHLLKMFEIKLETKKMHYVKQILHIFASF